MAGYFDRLMGNPLFTAGLGLLGAPRGQAISGGLLGMQAAGQWRQQQKEAAQQELLMQMKMQEYQAAQQKAAQEAENARAQAANQAVARDAIMGMNAPGTQPKPGAMYEKSPGQFVPFPSAGTGAIPEAQLRYTLSAGGMDPSKILPKAATPGAPITIKEGDEFVTYENLGEGRRGAVISRAPRYRPTTEQTVVLPPMQTAEDKAVGTGLGQEYLAIQKGAGEAREQVRLLEQVDALGKDLYTGTGGKAVQWLRRAGAAFKINVDEAGSGDAMQSFTRELALKLRNPAGGEGMPGQLSNADRDFLESMTPGLSMTPGGRKIVLEAAKRQYKRKAEIARLAQQYRAKNKTLDGFQQLVDETYSNVDTFADLRPAMERELAGAPADVPGASGGGLTPDEAAELEALKRQLGR